MFGSQHSFAYSVWRAHFTPVFTCSLPRVTDWWLCQYVVSHANEGFVSSPGGTTGCWSVRAGCKIYVCHLETTTWTGGQVQGKTCLTVQTSRQPLLFLHQTHFKTFKSFVLHIHCSYYNVMFFKDESGHLRHFPCSPVGYLATVISTLQIQLPTLKRCMTSVKPWPEGMTKHLTSIHNCKLTSVKRNERFC